MRRSLLLALSAIVLAPLVASAGPTLSFGPGKAARNTSLGGSQFSVELNDNLDGTVDFVFRNTATTALPYDAVTNDTKAVIELIAFADGITIAGGEVTDGTPVVSTRGKATGVAFEETLYDPVTGLQGFGGVAGFEPTAAFAATDADNPSPKYGIGAGEFLTITFVRLMKFDNIRKALSGEITDPDDSRLPALRIGMHVRSITSGGGSDVFVNVPPPFQPPPPPTMATPEPASLATAGMGVLMGLGYAWRRRKRASV